MIRPLQVLWSWFVAAWHGLAGRLWFRLGRTARARRHFERILDLRGEQFTAYVFLGRIAYGIGDYAGWRREFEHARRTDPERFARLRHPFELFEPRAAGTLFDEAGERATWRAMRLPSSRGRRAPVRSIEYPLDAPGGSLGSADYSIGPATEPSAHPMDDFLTEAERSRFRARPPITGGELHRADLDDLCRRLSE